MEVEERAMANDSQAGCEETQLEADHRQVVIKDGQNPLAEGCMIDTRRERNGGSYKQAVEVLISLITRIRWSPHESTSRHRGKRVITRKA